MKRPSISIVSLAIVSMLALTLIAAQPEAKEPGTVFLSVLHKQQTIFLNDLGSAFEITVFPNGPAPLGYEIVEVGRDFITVQDVTGIRKIRIPVYAIKSVITLKVMRK